MKRRLIFVASILTIVFALVYSYVFDSKLDLNGDNVHYLNLAYWRCGNNFDILDLFQKNV